MFFKNKIKYVIKRIKLRGFVSKAGKIMSMIVLIFIIIVVTVKMDNSSEENSIFYGVSEKHERRYKPEWSDLDTRPLPEWYDKAKIGIFIHWGVYSVPSFNSEWFWRRMMKRNGAVMNFMKSNFPPGFTYPEFAPMFNAEFFSPDQFADLFYKAGAKYVVLTSKHHDGYTLFPSKRSYNWNSLYVGPHRDLVGDLSGSIKAKGLKFGLYYSLYEWYNPLYIQDQRNGYMTRNYVVTTVRPEIEQIVKDYQPSVLWSDGDGEANDRYWNSTGLLAWLYNDSPVKTEVVVNDRWGSGLHCRHGDFYNCADRFNPGYLMNHKWENAFTLDKRSWGYRRNMNLDDVMCIEELIKQVVSTVSCGGNVLINVGPTKEGTIAPIFQERLLALGDWLKVNGEAIYSTSPWLYQNDTEAGDVWYTCTKTSYDAVQPIRKPDNSDSIINIYAIFLKWPRNDVLKLHFITSHLHGNYKVEMLGHNDFLQWLIKNNESEIMLPSKATVSGEYAWTLKIQVGTN